MPCETTMGVGTQTSVTGQEQTQQPDWKRLEVLEKQVARINEALGVTGLWDEAEQLAIKKAEIEAKQAEKERKAAEKEAAKEAKRAEKEAKDKDK